MAALGLASLPVMQQPFTPQQQQQQQPPLLSMQQQPAQQQQVTMQPIVRAAPPAPTPLDATAITVKLATLAGERFKEMFYTVFDTHRTDLHRFFTEQSVLVWEGTPVQGAHFQSLFEMLPASKHTVQTFDVQPITGGAPMSGSVNSLIVTVTGVVTWGLTSSDAAGTPNGFHHTFILERSSTPNSAGKQVHHVLTSIMRTRFIEEDPPQSLKKKRAFGR